MSPVQAATPSTRELLTSLAELGTAAAQLLTAKPPAAAYVVGYARPGGLVELAQVPPSSRTGAELALTALTRTPIPGRDWQLYALTPVESTTPKRAT